MPHFLVIVSSCVLERMIDRTDAADSVPAGTVSMLQAIRSQSSTFVSSSCNRSHTGYLLTDSSGRVLRLSECATGIFKASDHTFGITYMLRAASNVGNMRSKGNAAIR